MTWGVGVKKIKEDKNKQTKQDKERNNNQNEIISLQYVLITEQKTFEQQL